MHRPTAQELIDGAPPHDLNAERGLLGSLLTDPKLIDDVATVLRPDEFYSPAYRLVFGHMLAIAAEGKTIDAPMILGRLEAAGDLEAAGGTATLLDCAESCPWAGNALPFATTIRNLATARELKAACLQGASLADDRTTTAQDKLAKVEASLLAIAERRTVSQVGTIGERLTEAVEGIYERRRNGNADALQTPWPNLNRRTGGMRAGELWVLGGRPRMGKTSLALNLVDHVVRQLGQGVLFESLEMTAAELCEKLLAARTGLESAAIRDGNLSDDDMRLIVDGMSVYEELPLVIDDTPSRTLLDICSQARRLKRQGKLALLVVDHLGLIVPENPREPRHEQVSRITRRLKVLARELQVPILALAQLNRDVEKERDHRPKLSSLRESGSIEQDAGVVLFVHREEEYRPDDLDLRGKAELIIAKARAGEAGTVPLLWERSTQEFVPAAYGVPWTGLDE